jgi:hypothetical protein
VTGEPLVAAQHRIGLVVRDRARILDGRGRVSGTIAGHSVSIREPMN